MGNAKEHFGTEVADLPAAGPTAIVDLPAGGHLDLRVAPVAKRIGDDTLRMLAFNGSIPGPVLKVQEGSEVVVDVQNQGDMETTVHWHGPPPGEPLRRYAPGTGPDPGGRPVLRRDHLSRPGRLLVPPAHQVRLRHRDGAVRRHRGRAHSGRLLACRTRRGAAHPRRPPRRGGQGLPRSAGRSRRTRPWAVSATCSS